MLSLWTIRQAIWITMMMSLLCVFALWLGLRSSSPPILAYVHQVNPEVGQIYLVDVSRGISLQLTQYPTQHTLPTWSPDGDYLLFVMGGDFNFRTGQFASTRIIQMNMHTYKRSSLTDNYGLLSENMPAWSITGKVAYAVFDLGWDIAITRPNIPQTHLISTSSQGFNTSTSEHTPKWSDDGTQLAYLVGGQYFSELVIADVNGKNPRNLTSGMRIYQGQYDWSPTGTHIIFTSERDVNREIYLVNVSNGALINLSRNPANDSMPQWSPDGSQIAFISERSVPSELFIMSPDGRNVRQITTEAHYISHINWSPDGRWLAYSSDKGSSSISITRDIFIISAEGENSRRLTFSVSDEYSPVWKPQE